MKRSFYVLRDFVSEVIKFWIRSTNINIGDDDGEKNHAETNRNTKSRDSRSDGARQKLFIEGDNIDKTEINNEHEDRHDPAKTGSGFNQFKVIGILGDLEYFFIVHR